MKGWGPKSSVCPSKPRDTKLFGGTPGVPEKFEKTYMGEKKHINKIPPKILGQSREKYVYVCFFFKAFFDAPKCL